MDLGQNIYKQIKKKCIDNDMKLSDVLDQAGIKYSTFQTWKDNEPACIGQIRKVNQIFNNKNNKNGN